MGSSAPKAPPAPDPVATANAQGQMNLETARANAALNRVNQYTPQGSLIYSKANSGPPVAWDEASYMTANPDVAGSGMTGLQHYNKYGKNEGRAGVAAGYGDPMNDQWAATTTLSPEQQRLYDLSTQAQTIYGQAGVNQLNAVKDQLSRPFDPQNAPIQTSVADRSGGLVSSVDSSGILGGVPSPSQGVRYEAADTGQQQRAFTDTGDAQQILSDVGGPQRNMGDPANFAQDRNAVEAALYARLNPQLDRDRLGLETRLSNQGFTRGTQAWNSAMDDANRQSNDARLAVTAAGLNEQQGLYGMAANRFGAENAAQNQAATQALGANQQAYGQELGRGQFYNAAQAEDTSQALARTQLWNAAQGQEYGQNLQSSQFQNDAQNQRFGQNMQNAQLGNSTAQQATNMDLARGGFSNQGSQQQFQQDLATRNQPLNETSALLTGQQVQMPQFQQAPQVQVAPTDYLGATQLQSQVQMSNFNNKNANYQANLAGMYGLGNTAIQSGAYAAGQAGSNA